MANDKQNAIDEMMASMDAASGGEKKAEEKSPEAKPSSVKKAEKKNGDHNDIKPALGAKLQLTDEQKSNLSMILDLPLKVTVELGRSRVLIQDILQYGQGSVVELNKKAGDPLEITVNNQLIAKGEVVVVNEKFAVRILEIVDPETRIKRMGTAGRDSTMLLNEESFGGENKEETKKEDEQKNEAVGQ